MFGKRADGTLPLWSWVAFLPLLIYATVVWHLIRLLSREPAHNTVTEQLVVGRRLLAFERAGEFDNFVDLTAEFSEPSLIRSSPSYRSFPILDGEAPTPEAYVRRLPASGLAGRSFIAHRGTAGRDCSLWLCYSVQVSLPVSRMVCGCFQRRVRLFV